MPRLVTQADLEEEAREDREHLNRLAEVEEELAYYDPNGGWRFFKEKLDNLIETELNLLQECNLEEVPERRAKLKLLRHLVSIPDRLREEQARLRGMLDE